MLKRKIVSLISIAAILLQMQFTLLHTSASDSADGESLSHDICTETLSEEIASDSALYSSDSQSGYLTHDEAVKYAREMFVNRENKVLVNILSDTELPSTYSKSFFDEVVEHTKNPKEGDYIYQHISGYSVKTAYTQIDGVYYYTLTYSLSWFTTAEQEKEVDVAVAELMTSLNLSGKNGYDKIKTIYDYISDNIKYDHDSLEYSPDNLEHSAYAALIKKVAVCQGIASLFYRLCLEADIDVRVITGYGDGERHAWNIVQLNGSYYECDPTWDLGISVYYRYFMCTKYNFVNHTRDSKFKTSSFEETYPMAEVPYGISVEVSGVLKTGMNWYLSKDGTLTISGQGAMPDFKNIGAPWYPYADSVLKIVLEEGITTVGDYSFVRCKNATEVVFPSTLKEIHHYGFDNCRSIKELSLPYGLVKIETKAFSECMALTRVELPDSVVSVDSSVFSLCQNLTYIKLSAGMKTIPDSMFFAMGKLKTVIIPEGITSIGDTAFRMCDGITSITIPSQIVSIGTAAFTDCENLSNIYVASGNKYFKSINGVLFSYDMKSLICFPAAKRGSYTIPEGVTRIEHAAFGSSKLSSVTLPDSLRYIEVYGFSRCPFLKTITVGKNVTFLGSTAFGYSTGLESVVFENPNTVIDGSAFCGCTSLKSVTLPANLKKIETSFFSECKSLKSINIPSSVTVIESSAFSNCKSLVSVEIPASVKKVGHGIFNGCEKLRDVTFLGDVNNLDFRSFKGCSSLRYIHFSGRLGTVDSTAFDNTKLKTLYLDNQVAVSRISSKTACGNMLTHIKTFAIKNNITYIPQYVKNNYTYVSEITFKGELYTLYSDHKCSWLYDGGKRCRVCDAVNDIANHTHTYTSVVTPPSCDEQGFTTYTCGCGESYKGNYTQALGHSYIETILVKATCTTKGIIRYSCERCPEEILGNYIDPLNHTYTSTITPPTCIEQGYTTHTCECGDTYVDSYTSPKGHAYIESVIPPTETEQGYTLHTCKDCGDTYMDNYTDPVPQYLKGDINGDGRVNNRDAARLMQYLAGWDVEYVETALDVNGDGRINNRDAARLMQYLAGWDVEIY